VRRVGRALHADLTRALGYVPYLPPYSSIQLSRSIRPWRVYPHPQAAKPVAGLPAHHGECYYHTYAAHRQSRRFPIFQPTADGNTSPLRASRMTRALPMAVKLGLLRPELTRPDGSLTG
jgi:hypothetical protein